MRLIGLLTGINYFANFSLRPPLTMKDAAVIAVAAVIAAIIVASSIVSAVFLAKYVQRRRAGSSIQGW